MNSNIVKLDDIARGSTEHQALVNSLEVLDWTLQTQTLIKATGLPLGEMLSERKTRVPNGSLAQRLGHSTLESFITSDKDEYGLGKRWDDWNEYVTAFRYKSLYDIYVEDPSQIILQFKDVCKILGHIPANSAEYHQAKDSHLVEQKNGMREKHELELAEMHERVRDLIQGADRSSTELKKEREIGFELKTKYDALILETNQQLDLARKEMKQDKVQALEAQKQELEMALEERVEIIRHSSELQVSEANERLADTKAKYNSVNFVSKQEHSAVQQQLTHERDSVRDILVRLNDAEIKLKSSDLNVQQRNSQINALEKTIDEQTILIGALQSQLVGAASDSVEFSTSELSQMSARIETLETYLAKFRTSSNNWKGRNQKAHLKIEKLTATLIDAKKALKAKESAKSNKKMLIGFLAITSIVMTIATTAMLLA